MKRFWLVPTLWTALSLLLCGPAPALADFVTPAGVPGSGAMGGGGGSGNVTTAGGTDNHVAIFTSDSETIENSAAIDDGILFTYGACKQAATSAADGTRPFFDVTGTLPTGTANNTGVNFSVTGAGAASFVEIGVGATLGAGYTGSSTTIGLSGTNSSAGTGALTIGGVGNRGVSGASNATTTGGNVAIYGTAQGGGASYGVLGNSITAKSGAINVGVAGYGRNSGGGGAIDVGLWGSNSGSLDTMVACAIGGNNGATGNPLLVLLDNGTTAFRVAVGGVFNYSRTITAAGTTGAQTIDKPAGCVNFAAAATTLVVTDTYANANSIIMANAMTNDATCHVKDVERAVGSFTIRMTAACTAETAVCFTLAN